MRGAGKTTSITALREKLGESGLTISTIEMDSYFKPLEECKAPGGWDNPRNSNLGALAATITAFKSGRKIRVPVGRVPRHGEIEIKEIDPAKSDVLLVEGIHGLESKISRLADIKGFFYVPPGLQEIRTWLRDLERDKAKQMPPEYYLGINVRVRPWQSALILPRMKDAEILFEQKLSMRDLDAIAGLMGFDNTRKNELAQAWGITK